MALDKRAWRCQKGHGAQEKGHGAAPCYFALDLTLVRLTGTFDIKFWREQSMSAVYKFCVYSQFFIKSVLIENVGFEIWDNFVDQYYSH